MNCNIKPLTEEQIHAYVDGQLDLAEREAVESRLATDAKAAARVAAYQEQNRLMQQLFDPILDEPVPVQLTQPVKVKTKMKWNLVANITLILVGSLLGWISRGSFIPATVSLASLPQSATIAHAVYAPEVSHPVEVTAEHEAHLVKWLSKRLGKDVHAPDLTRVGFNLIGGRLLPAVDGPAAQFMYEDGAGNRMTLYVRNNPGEKKNTAFRYQETGENKVFYWVDGNLGYALTATIDKKRLLDAANNVYHALSF
jgi:anti-sigma factor RsiW